jgi:hypothetical protein
MATITEINNKIKHQIKQEFDNLPKEYYQESLAVWSEKVADTLKKYPSLKASNEFSTFINKYMPTTEQMKSYYDNHIITLSNRIHELEAQLEAKDLIIKEYYLKLEALEEKQCN